ncbi:class II aldolase/adducin family protein [Evansella clarkii]|jgi:ribulose-5-phosphate 4-epimerase/fuculose-1-phosphate aldolase|uniref:class II aldolase/adducin family protein n=1 Tax=Evansella clarkii TaxID=79879 RepID=UPI000B43026B|nr:class II aldolase/adducin family protein [Evansella clarkii]
MNTFTINGEPANSFTQWLTEGIKQTFSSKDFIYMPSPEENVKLVFHLTDNENPRPFRRHSQATFVVSIIVADEYPADIHKEAYPYLIRTLANHLMYVVHTKEETEIYFLTPEQGRYSITFASGQSDEDTFGKIYERLEPLALSRLVINNDFYEDLPEPLWEGDEVTGSLRDSGKKLDSLNLLPAPFPLEEVLTERDIRHLNKLYGIGGLSYGNLSARKDGSNFWMSASGIDKSNMNEVGKDFLYISGYDDEKKSMKVSIPPKIKPKRASVDAIEHWMIYREHPDVGAIVHIHAWMDGVEATQFNYPCGTIELAENVAELVSKSPDPGRTVIGLKNHGLTITGRDLNDIFDRIEGKIIPQVPMH